MTQTPSGGSSVRIPKALPDGVSQATIGVRGGLLRSEFEETAEAMYLTSGYVYESAAAAERAPSPARSIGMCTPVTATPRSPCSRSGCG